MVIEIQFATSTLKVVQMPDGFYYVPIADLCGLLNIDVTKPVQRLKQHFVFAKRIVNSVDNSSQELLRLDVLALWLATLDRAEVIPAAQEELERYQQEAAIILQESFLAGRLTEQAMLSELLKHDTVAVRAYHEAVAIVSLIRNQILTEADLRGI